MSKDKKELKKVEDPKPSKAPKVRKSFRALGLGHCGVKLREKGDVFDMLVPADLEGPPGRWMEEVKGKGKSAKVESDEGDAKDSDSDESAPDSGADDSDPGKASVEA